MPDPALAAPGSAKSLREAFWGPRVVGGGEEAARCRRTSVSWALSARRQPRVDQRYQCFSNLPPRGDLGRSRGRDIATKYFLPAETFFPLPVPPVVSRPIISRGCSGRCPCKTGGRYVRERTLDDGGDRLEIQGLSREGLSGGPVPPKEVTWRTPCGGATHTPWAPHGGRGLSVLSATLLRGRERQAPRSCEAFGKLDPTRQQEHRGREAASGGTLVRGQPSPLP